ncbi:MAG: YceI family protein [Hyphomicrobiales bacterium]
MRSLLISLFVAVFVSGAAADAPQWSVNKETSKLGFVVSIMGGKRAGQFSDYDAKIAISPEDLDTSRVELDIDLGSAKTGHGDIDKAMPSSDWFAISDFPKATFASTAIRHISDNAYEMDGKLKLRGVEKALTIPFTLDIDGDRARANGSVELDRTVFGIGQGEFTSGKAVGLAVDVVFELEATRVP